MTFLAMIVGLLLLQFWGEDNPVHWDGWFHGLRARLGEFLRSPFWLTIAALVVPGLLLYWLLGVARPLLFGFVWIVIAGMVLLYGFGRGDFEGLLARYRSYCLQEDFEGAYLFISQQSGGTPVAAENPADFHRQARAVLLYEGYQRWFPVLFYFLLLGPVGALVYRLGQLSLRATGEGADRQLVHVFDWLPARLLALSFAVTGDFVRSREALGRCLLSNAPAPSVLTQVACAAAIGPAAIVPADLPGGVGDGAAVARETAELSDLLSRSAVLWVALAAVATLLA